MELHAVAFALLLAVSTTAVLGCDQQKLTGECMGFQSKITQVLPSGGTPNKEQMKKLCRLMNEFTECVTSAMSGCSADLQKSVDQMKAGMAQYKAECAKMGAGEGGSSGSGNSGAKGGGDGNGADSIKVFSMFSLLLTVVAARLFQ